MASFAPIRGTRTQINNTPIVDGQFLVETDQGIENKIYMDEGSTRTIVGGNTVSGVLPELYIYSETGSIVTVEDEGGTLIPTSQIGTDHWICSVPDYGVYTVYSVLSGDTTTQSVNVTDCMIYTIDDSHFHCNIEVTYPSGVGAICTISGGGETYSAPALNPPNTSYKFVVHGKNTTYTITTNVDGCTKTDYVATGTTLDQTYQITMPYARINLTVEAPPITGNITCTDGTTTITKAVSPNMTLYVPNTGTWTISGSDGMLTYDISVEINSLSDVVNKELATIPNGSTVLPINDVQTWLQCANIRDKTSYSTLDDIFDDDETLQKLINNENAVDYLVRCKEWISAIDGLVPELTSTSANVTTSTDYSGLSYPYKVFDRDWDKSPLYTMNGCWAASGSTTNNWIAYEFPTAQSVRTVKIRGGVEAGTTQGGIQTSSYSGIYRKLGVWSFKVQYSDTGATNDWIDVDDGANFQIYNDSSYTFNFQDNGSHKFWRIYITDSVSSIQGLANLQFYGLSITSNEYAMRYIGRCNYAANTLLSDNDWANSIGTSPYLEGVLNKKVPTMTGTSTPSGEAFSSGTYSSNAYYAWYPFAGYMGQSEHSTGRWCGTFGSATGYVGYEFTVPVAVNKVVMLNQGEAPANNNPADYTGEIEYYDGTQWVSIHSFSSPKECASNNHVMTFANTVASTKWRVYFNSQVINYQSSVFNEVAELQFYGRVDVTQGLNIYSAADDTVTISDGTSTITVTTDDTGFAVLTTPLTVGTSYTFTSGVADNPSSMGAFYSKTKVIYNDMIAVMVMPNDGRNVLYWYGYQSLNLEDCIAKLGWSSYSSSFPLQTPTYNLRDITTTSSSGYITAVGNKTPLLIPANTDGKMIAQGVSGAGGEYGWLYISNIKTVGSGTQTIQMNNNSKQLWSGTMGTNKYTQYGAGNGRTSRFSAMWFE